MRVSIHRVWTGNNPPTHCPVHIEPLEIFNEGFRDDGYQGLWKCPKCNRYLAWKPESSEFKEDPEE